MIFHVRERGEGGRAEGGCGNERQGVMLGQGAMTPGGPTMEEEKMIEEEGEGRVASKLGATWGGATMTPT